MTCGELILEHAVNNKVIASVPEMNKVIMSRFCVGEIKDCSLYNSLKGVMHQ